MWAGARCSLLLIVAVAVAVGVAVGENDLQAPVDYRGEMRQFVQSIASYARGQTGSQFVVIPQNGAEILSSNSKVSGPAAAEYIAAIDAVGREDLFYVNDAPTSSAERSYMLSWTGFARTHGLEVLAIDYCSTHSKIDDSYNQSFVRGYVSTATDRQLKSIPAYPSAPYNSNTRAIDTVANASNFLYLLNSEDFASKSAFLSALQATQFDLFVIDAFASDGSLLTSSEIASLKTKPSGAKKRLVLAYMSIGEAEDYRWYWQSVWKTQPPSWLGPVNPDWGGNYKVRYWEPEWQKIILGSASSYIGKIASSGFDGVYLDIIDAYEFWESYVEPSSACLLCTCWILLLAAVLC